MTFDQWFNENCKGMSAEAYRVMQMAWNARAERIQGDGVTAANWKEHDGSGVPEEIAGQPGVLVQLDNGAFSFKAHSCDYWFSVVDCPTVARYTIVDP